jgi:hypothetical protein
LLPWVWLGRISVSSFFLRPNELTPMISVRLASIRERFAADLGAAPDPARMQAFCDHSSLVRAGQVSLVVRQGPCAQVIDWDCAHFLMLCELASV